MADPEPLLPQSTNTSDHKTATIDDLIEQTIGKISWAQITQSILVSLASVFDSQQAFLSVYTEAEPTWHCLNATSCDPCRFPSSSDWSWDRTSSSSIISEWGLQCSNSIIRGFPASAHFMGCIIGTFFVTRLADSPLGRKNMLFLSSLVMSVTTLLTILSPNVWIYSLMRFITGVGRSSIGTCTIVLLVEKVGKKWRNLVGILDFFFFTAGIVSLPGIAFINRDRSWRSIYLWTSIPALIYCLVLCFVVTESPRWLFMQGREQDAIQTLKTLSVFTDSDHIQLQKTALYEITVSKTENCSTVKELFNRRWSRHRILTLIALGFGIGLTYYGMTLGIGNLGFHIYLSVVFNGLLEIPAFFITYLVIEKWKRRNSLLITCSMSGILSVMIIFSGENHNEVKMGLELASFFGACTAYNVVLIYAIELFPTCVRNFATSMARQSITFGAVLSSLLVSAGGDEYKLVPYVVFGLAIMCCGFFVVCLPETKGVPLCDTMDEQEREEYRSVPTVLLF